MVKAVVFVLTSNKLKLLHRCIKSVDNQFPVNFEYDKKIIVNTLNDNYYKKVLEHYEEREDWEIIRTESNGRPGRGHNSLFDVFKERTEYDYMIPIDGDDLYYPCAFELIEKSFIEEPDILHLMLNDYISILDKPRMRKLKLKGNYKLYGSFNEEKNWWNTIPVKNPFVTPIQKCKTPTRIILASRNIFNTTVPIRYSEKMKLYDDYISFLGIYEAHLREELNIFALSNSHIYHYNATNDDSVSVKFNDPVWENNVFKEESVVFEKAKVHWNLPGMKFLSLGTSEKFTVKDKINFCQQVIADIIDEKWSLVNKLMKENETDKLIKHLRFLMQSGLDDTYYVNFNLGVCYFKNGNYTSAIHHLDRASYLKPTLEVFEYLYNISVKINSVKRTRYYIEHLTNLSDDEKFKRIKVNLDRAVSFEKQQHKNFEIRQWKKPKKTDKPIVAYYTGYSGKFNGKNYQNAKSVWGSEIAAVKLCEELVKLGYDVHIFCMCDEELTHNGVTYHDKVKYQNFQFLHQIDYLIVSRFLHFFLENVIDVGKVIFLMHDARGHNHWLNTQLPNLGNFLYYNLLNNMIDQIVCVSNWQVDNFHKISGFDKKLFKVIPNGVNSSMFNNSRSLISKKTKHRFIYCSDPDRGLKPLVDNFDKIREILPDAELDIYFGKISKDIFDKIQKRDYIRFNGKLSNNDLIKEMKKCDYWLYPNFNSHETFCITALEAMGTGCIPITRHFSGLVGTIGSAGKLIAQKKTVTEFFDEVITIIKELENNPELKDKIREECIERAMNFDWKIVAKQWKKEILI